VVFSDLQGGVIEQINPEGFYLVLDVFKEGVVVI
jgi:hypothetical protein